MTNFSFKLGHRPPSASPFTIVEQFVLFIAGYDPEILKEHAPRYEFGLALALGCIAVISIVVNAGIFGLAAHMVFGDGQFSIWLMLAGTALAATFGGLESFVGRASHIALGLRHMVGTGLELSLPGSYGGSSRTFSAFRLSLGLTSAFIASTFLSLAIYKADIAARAELDYQTRNPVVFQQAKQAFEVEERRMTSVVAQQEARVTAVERMVNTLNQADVRRSVNANRRSAPLVPVIERAQLDKLEKTLADENLKLATFRSEASALRDRRNSNIRHAIETSPNATPRQEGLIGQLTTLGSLIAENYKVLCVVLALDFLLAGIDCAGFIARMAAPASIYDTFLARDFLVRSVSISKDCAEQLAALDTASAAEGVDNERAVDAPTDGGAIAPEVSPSGANDNVSPTNDNLPALVSGEPLTPAKRGRGRPRKGQELNGQAAPDDPKIG